MRALVKEYIHKLRVFTKYTNTNFKRSRQGALEAPRAATSKGALPRPARAAWKLAPHPENITRKRKMAHIQRATQPEQPRTSRGKGANGACCVHLKDGCGLIFNEQAGESRALRLCYSPRASI